MSQKHANFSHMFKYLKGIEIISLRLAEKILMKTGGKVHFKLRIHEPLTTNHR